MQFKGLGVPQQVFCNAKVAVVYTTALLAGAMNPLNVLSKFENHFAIKTVHFQVSLEAGGYFFAQEVFEFAKIEQFYGMLYPEPFTRTGPPKSGFLPQNRT